MSTTLNKPRSPGHVLSKKSLPKFNTHKVKYSESIKKTVDIPLWAYCNDEFFEVANVTDFDFEKINPFDREGLLASASLEMRDLLKIGERYKEQPLLPLPKWHLDVQENEMNLQFTYSKDLFQESDPTETLNLPVKSREVEFLNNRDIKNEKTFTIRNEKPVTITKIEKGKSRIENLEVSTQTKRLILEKYYRGKNHPDLRKVKGADKVFSAILYELFSKVYKERPTVEVNEIARVGEGDSSEQKYIAHHIFNSERLTTGIGHSKKQAKCDASLKSLQIFAPSLIENIEKETSVDTGLNIEEVSKLQSSKDVETLCQEEIKFVSPMIIEVDKETTNVTLDTDYGKKGHSVINLESPTAENLAIEFPQALANAIKDPATMTRLLTFYEVYMNLLKFGLKEEQDLEKRLENRESLEIEDPVDYYCTNKIFTKLYLLHSLLNKKGRQFPLVNCVQVGKMFNVYLHSPELNRNFIYQSGSYELGVEMTKQQLIFALYPECLGFMDILEEMKSKYEQEKTRILNKAQEYQERTQQQYSKSVSQNQKRFSNRNNCSKDRWGDKRDNNPNNSYRPHLKYTYNKFHKYQKGTNAARNNSVDIVEKKVKVFV